MRRGIQPMVLCLLALAAGHAGGQPADVEPGPLGMTLGELEDELRRRQEDLARYQTRLDELERQNVEVRAELETRAQGLSQQEEQVRGRLITLCRLNQGGYFLMLQDARSLADLFRRVQLVRSLVDGDLAALREHQREVEALELQRRQLDRRLVAQRQLQERIARYQEELEAERERRLSVGTPGPASPYDLGGDSEDPFAAGAAFDL